MSSEPPKQEAQLPQESPQSPKSPAEGPQVEPVRASGQRVFAQISQEQWSGPIPPPAVLERLDRVVPGGAERVLRMAEKEQAHRIAYEREGLAASKADAWRGQYLGAAISLTAIIGAVVA